MQRVIAQKPILTLQVECLASQLPPQHHVNLND